MLPAHPAFSPFARWLNRVPHEHVPSIATWNEWAAEAGLALPGGHPLAFVAAPRKAGSALDYERRIADRGEIALRPGSVHDMFNALAWLAFPRSKSALNAIHVESALSPTGNARNRARDAATLLDEGGMLVWCADRELLALWQARAWREVFWTRREEVARAMRVAVIGHGLLHKLLRPYATVTAGALVVAVDRHDPAQEGAAARVDPPQEGAVVQLDPAQEGAAAQLDAAGARRLNRLGSSLTPAALLPLPTAALPGWNSVPGGFCESRFDDLSVFRPPPRP